MRNSIAAVTLLVNVAAVTSIHFFGASAGDVLSVRNSVVSATRELTVSIEHVHFPSICLSINSVTMLFSEKIPAISIEV